MLQKLISVILLFSILAGCAPSFGGKQKRQYQASFLTLFDTVTTIIGYAHTEEEFEETANEIQKQLEKYHQMFDIYNEYEENNLKTINDKAGREPVRVENEIIEFLLDCKKYYTVTQGKVNIAMGSVLHLWHEAREQGIHNPAQAKLPDRKALEEAAKHCNIEDIIIDETKATVFLKDSQMRLDVGAIAKGWAVEAVCNNAPEGLLVSVGGNVRATGPKSENVPWVVGIQSPWGDSAKYLHTVQVNRESVVTSGDYQRYYTVEETNYHHLIDPETLYPGKLWKSVSILCEDSGAADALSTALFFLTKEEGQKILEQYDAYAMWVDFEGEIYYSTGFEAFIRT